MLTVSRASSTSLGSEASGMDHHTVETCTVVRWISISGIFWEEWTPCAPDQRRKGSSRLLPAQVQQARGCHGMGLCQCPWQSNLHFCDGTINAEKYIEILSTICCLQETSFQGCPCIFQQDNAKTTFCTHYKVLAAEERVRVLDWPACLQSRPVSNRECVAHLKRKCDNEDPYCCPP